MPPMRDLFSLTDEQRRMRDLVRTLARARIAPRAARWTRRRRIPRPAAAPWASRGSWGSNIPEAFGGSEMGALAFCLAVEEIAWACASTGVLYLVQYAGGFPIVPPAPRRRRPRECRAP